MGRCSYSWEEWNEKKDEFVKKCCQKEAWKGSDEFCIFHDPSPEKDANLFRKLIEEQIRTETEKHDFTGYYFPEKWDFFAGKKFERSASFRGTTFQDADFRGTTFQGTAHFRGAVFKDANFPVTTFNKTADFSRAFFQSTDFLGSTFQGEADFRGATFQWTANFRGSIFQDHADFRGATFRNTVNFRGTTFQDETDFSENNFRDADFLGATFNGTAKLLGATFRSTANFWGVTFQDVNFGGTTFKDANFQDTIFDGAAKFRRSAFRSYAYFKEAIFQDKTDFSEAVFWSTANFPRSNFQGGADFSGCIFKSTTDFSKAIFKGQTFFRGSSFEKQLGFIADVTGKVDFRRAEFLFRSKVTANLEEALYQGSFIENVAFIDCRWPEDYVIYEEKHMNDEKINLSFSQLETIYRDLKQNMQNHGDYVRAGEFYYREMEMRRKGISGKKINRWWLEVYRFLAGYGEKPERTFLSSFFTIALFAVLYWYLACLHYPEDIHTVVEKLICSLYFSFVTFTTLGLGDIRPMDSLGRGLVCCEAVIGAFLIALFVVVFARKMMR